ncbi:MAG: serine--tRNA ligase [Candidatus Magasanikbacteria bacterium]
MLDLKFIRENKELIQKNCENRRVKVDVERLLVLDEQKRALQHEIDDLRALRNQKSKGKPTEEEITKMREVGDNIKNLEEKMSSIEIELNEILLMIPNLTHPDSPIGGEEDYTVIYTNKEPNKFSFETKDHEELMTNLDMIDFERGAKVAGSKFYFYKNDGVRMNQALINYGMDILSKHGYILLETPDVAKQEILIGAGFNPRGAETQVYNIEGTDLCLIGTAEISTLGYHANEVLDLSHGPIKYAAISHSFRTEAGAYGKTSKGLYRVHQFTKLEMFIFSKPEDSEKLHEELLSIEKEICDGLEIPYRVIDIPTGDLGGPAYRKYDIEAWMTMKNDYGEITSTSNCTDYQARRLNIKYTKEDGTKEYVHTLNGTAVVLSRFPIALAENHQQEDGKIAVPQALQKFIGKTILG